jgi:ABC exporter DevB family membrane fusion protein
MRKTLILSSIAIILTMASLAYFFWFQPSGVEQQVSANEKDPEVEITANTVVAPGVVEPISEEIEVGTEIPGKLKQVLVEEGQEIVKRQKIAILENLDFKTQISEARARITILQRQKETARARLLRAKADQTRMFNGARPVERREAKRSFEETLPEISQAKSEYERRQKLFATGDISREEVERAGKTLENAERKSLTVRERFNVINADARKDDLRKAEAAIILAETQVREFDALLEEAEVRVRTAQANLDKTIIKSPITGIVLRKRSKAGESVSPESQVGIVSIADVSALRIRVDLDETDVARVSVGQKTLVKADAYGDQQFQGKIIRIGQIMGRKNFRTERPTEKVDTKILEVLIELEPDTKLPLGLRVDAFISGKK